MPLPTYKCIGFALSASAVVCIIAFFPTWERNAILNTLTQFSLKLSQADNNDHRWSLDNLQGKVKEIFFLMI